MCVFPKILYWLPFFTEPQPWLDGVLGWAEAEAGGDPQQAERSEPNHMGDDQVRLEANQDYNEVHDDRSIGTARLGHNSL